MRLQQQEAQVVVVTVAIKPLRSPSCARYRAGAKDNAHKRLTVFVTVQEIDRQRFLLRYVQNVGPEVMEDFVRHAPAHVSSAQDDVCSVA